MGLLQTVISGQRVRSNHAHIVRRARAGHRVRPACRHGATLPGDAELMARFGVSRTVLREAMKTLAAKGLIVSRARIGTRVTERASLEPLRRRHTRLAFHTGIDEEFLVHISEIRLAFEPFAAGLAAERASESDIVQLARLATDIGDCTTPPRALRWPTCAFISRWRKPRAIPSCAIVGNLIEAALVGVFKISSPANSRVVIEETLNSHQAIVDAIRRRDAEAARKAMETVILIGLGRVRRELRPRQPPGIGAGAVARRPMMLSALPARISAAPQMVSVSTLSA